MCGKIPIRAWPSRSTIYGVPPNTRVVCFQVVKSRTIAHFRQNLVALLTLWREHIFRDLGEIWQFSLLKRDFFCFLFEIGSQWVSMECSPVPDTFLEIPLMCAASQTRRSSRRRQQGHLGKPRGILAPRVQAVGPSFFKFRGISARYGNVRGVLFWGSRAMLTPPREAVRRRAWSAGCERTLRGAPPRCALHLYSYYTAVRCHQYVTGARTAIAFLIVPRLVEDDQQKTIPPKPKITTSLHRRSQPA